MALRWVLVGAGGHGTLVRDALETSGHEVVALFDSRFEKGTVVDGLPILGMNEDVAEFGADAVGIAFGDNGLRLRLLQFLSDKGCNLPAVVHPTAFVSRSASLGMAAYIGAGAIVNPKAHIGDGSIVNTAASVDHDCRLERVCFVGPGAHIAGSVEVGEGAFIGIGANIKQGLTVGKWSTVGGGAMVIRDVADYATVLGIPARQR